MAVKVTQVKLDSRGMRELLNEQFVRDHLTKRADRVLSAAQAGSEEFDYHIEQATTDRAVVRVGSDDDGVLFAEASTGNLLRALDAGAGA
jgi:hypothetical protein